MPRDLSVEWLERLMGNEPMDVPSLDSFLKAKPGEGLHHDYKDVRVLDKNDGARDLRRDIVGFANSDGGFLVVGVPEEKPRHVAGSTRSVAELTSWATNALTPVKGQLSPPPRISIVEHGGGNVLIIATARAPRLVALAGYGVPIYPLRVGDQTVDADSYLAADLLLGRRQHPELVVADVRISGSEAQTMDVASGTDQSQRIRVAAHKFGISLILGNESLVWAGDVVFGGLFPTLSQSPHPVPEALWQYVQASRERSDGIEVSHFVGDHGGIMNQEPMTIAPFRVSRASVAHNLWLPTDTTYVLDAGIYAMPRGSPPQWWQLTARYSANGRQLLVGPTKITRCYDDPPRVALSTV